MGGMTARRKAASRGILAKARQAAALSLVVGDKVRPISPLRNVLSACRRNSGIFMAYQTRRASADKMLASHWRILLLPRIAEA